MNIAENQQQRHDGESSYDIQGPVISEGFGQIGGNQRCYQSTNADKYYHGNICALLNSFWGVISFTSTLLVSMMMGSVTSCSAAVRIIIHG